MENMPIRLDELTKFEQLEYDCCGTIKSPNLFPVTAEKSRLVTVHPIGLLISCWVRYYLKFDAKKAEVIY